MEITKRDYFAAQALTGLLLRSSANPNNPTTQAEIAAEAYLYADEMLKLSKTLLDPVEIDPDKMALAEQPKSLKEAN